MIKKRIFFIIPFIFMLLLSSCAKDAEKANIVLLSPFYLENGEIKAEFVNAGDIRLTDYIKSNVSFETEDMEENYYSETEILSPETGENRFRLHFSGGEVYILTIKNIAADELFAAVKGDGIFAVGATVSLSDFEITAISGDEKIALPESAVEMIYDFSVEGETAVEFYCGGLYAEVTVNVRGEYIPALDEDMRSPDGAVYAIDEKGAVLINGRRTRDKVSIPRAVTVAGKEYPVYAIGDRAFRGNQNITAVSCPFVSEIQSGAFYECMRLKTAELPRKNCTVGENAFAFCSSLYSVKLPTDINEISDGLFSDCGSLSSLDIPPSVTYIGNYAFARCDFLEGADIPKNVTYIGDGAFKDCTSLSGVLILGADVNYIGDGAFYRCDALSYIVVPPSPEYIGTDAFAAENIFVYTAAGKTSAYYMMKNKINYEKWQTGTIGIINLKTDYNIGEEPDAMNDFIAVYFTENEISRIYAEPEYNFAISGRRRVDISCGGLTAGYFVYVNYTEAMISADTDSRGATYEIDEYAGTAKLISLPDTLRAGEVYRFPADVYVLPNYVSYHGELYAVKEIGSGAFAGKNLRAIFLHDAVSVIEAGAIKDCPALEVFSVGVPTGTWVDIDEDNFTGVPDGFAFVCMLRHSAAHLFALKRQWEPTDYESAPHFCEYFGRR